jgi:chromosome segregation ATPase
VSGRLRELENTCEDLRRRLSEERTVKENFEDLLAALKDELQSSHNERDNLRDEIVPQLRARVEGLEAQTAEHEKLAYEHTKMQQEMQVLRDENTALTNARRLQMEMQQQISRFNSIDEEAAPVRSRASVGLSRSNSVAQSSGFQRSVGTPPLTRSTSVKAGESREVLAERLRDVEQQRDALHRALKSLLERQDYSNRENEKRIRQLEIERDRAVSNSPRRQGYDREVRSLREEINTLRRRADEAIEQKWQCEKGLSGLKMDLERAEQEIGSLRSLLQDNEIAVPGESGNSNGGKPRSNSAASEALERAYEELQKSYAQSLDRIRELEDTGLKDEETEAALARLQQSLSEAISERDFARQEAETYRQTADSLRSTEKEHMTSETSLAEELRASAERVEELATQVRQQLAANAALRQRLTETIDRGEKEQKANTSRIMHMQGKLRSLEDALMAAQQASEERVAKHEEEILELKKSHSAQLLRAKDGLKTPRLFSPKSPLSPLFAGARSPRLDATTSGTAMSIGEESKTEFLKKRVVELETALEEADKEMEEVVGKMNVAQIEVMDLQNEREEAVRQTRKLQAMIEEERLKGFRERFASLSS